MFHLLHYSLTLTCIITIQPQGGTQVSVLLALFPSPDKSEGFRQERHSSKSLCQITYEDHQE